jgi:hypothetical protein
MMKRIIPLLLLLQATAFAQQEQAKKEPKDPKVIERLNEMGKYLRSLKQFELNADVDFEVLVEKDQKIDVVGELHYKAKSPNKLWVELLTAHKHREYFYDGSQFTVFAPEQKFYAVSAAPKTLSEFVDVVQEKFNVEFPLSDLFDWGTDKGNLDQVTLAQFVEEFSVGKKKYDHYFVRQGKIDWQVWIPQGKNPLPEKLVYVSNEDPMKPKFSTDLEWKINSQFNDKVFNFVPPKNAHKIEMNAVKQQEKK